tara:strand:- start:46 stop:564 length:519 start_codon:yes stop_codon:yes gene_type:complete
MLNFTKGIRHTILIVTTCFISPTLLAASYLKTEKPFIMIKDEYRKAEAWGTCVAAYDIMSMIQGEAAPATAKQFSDRSNGAKMALYMDYFMGMDSDSGSSQISVRNKMAKLLSDSIPETQLTAMMAEGEQTKYGEEWLEKIVTTLELCINNLDEQQRLIDLWRSMYASGAFE